MYIHIHIDIDIDTCCITKPASAQHVYRTGLGLLDRRRLAPTSQVSTYIHTYIHA